MFDAFRVACKLGIYYRPHIQMGAQLSERMKPESSGIGFADYYSYTTSEKKNLKVISKHRWKIMGLAIISIILFHYLDDVRISNNASFGLIKIAEIYNKVPFGRR